MLNSNPLKQTAFILLRAIILPPIQLWMFLSNEVEYGRWQDEQHEMVVSYPQYAVWFAGLLGDWTAHLGIVRVFDRDGVYLGAQSIATMQREPDLDWVL